MKYGKDRNKYRKKKKKNMKTFVALDSAIAVRAISYIDMYKRDIW